ncbi:jg10924 [Pararge aegeria aegeria]|uniref:Jg10924 protein n=1 Tax=Pararge aegeria aegeria TaxID=348720 RepID=A0A8S4SA18_9NEOP|nr:jg10924 [Pararge aegeria aegeria]
MGPIRRLRVTQPAMERAMLGVPLRDQIRNEEIRRRTKVTDIGKRVSKAEVAIGGAHSSENRWTLEFQGVGVSTPNQVKASRGEPLDKRGKESWSLERPTKDQCPAVDVNRLI